MIEQARDERKDVVVQDVERALTHEDGEDYLDVLVNPLWGRGGRWLGAPVTFTDVTER